MGRNLEPGYLEAIWKVTETLQSEEQLEDAASVCLDIYKETVGAKAGLAWLQNMGDDRLYIVACTGCSDVTGMNVPAGEGVLGNCIKQQEAVQTDADSDEGNILKSESGLLGLDITNSLIIPLSPRAGVCGCIQLLNKEGGFSESDIALGGNIIALIAMDARDKGFKVRYDADRKPIIKLTNVVKEFPSGEDVLRVLKGIDLTIYEREFLVILGESGCGKTTMLNIIGGMDSMTSGSMTVDDKDFSKPSDKELTKYRKDYVGFVFQNYNLMPNLSAVENVQFIAENSKNPISSDEAIAMVGLTDRKNNLPSQMSGGQQQRVSIARALVKNPRVILADEPTAALDFKTSIEVLGIVERIVRDENKSVVMITHNAEIAKMADRVVRLKEGCIASIRRNNHPLSASELSW